MMKFHGGGIFVWEEKKESVLYNVYNKGKKESLMQVRKFL
jgi:hypothetical protein